MAIIRWKQSPAFGDLDNFHDEVNRLFDGFFTPAVKGAIGFIPPTDIEETADSFVLRLDLPGVKTEEVKLTVLGDTLTIRGERKPGSETNANGLYRRERRYGTFERAFRLGRSVKAEQVEASFRDGVLEVRVPKADEARPRDIQIQVR
jgi:HSP20 family protein